MRKSLSLCLVLGCNAIAVLLPASTASAAPISRTFCGWVVSPNSACSQYWVGTVPWDSIAQVVNWNADRGRLVCVHIYEYNAAWQLVHDVRPPCGAGSKEIQEAGNLWYFGVPGYFQKVVVGNGSGVRMAIKGQVIGDGQLYSS